MSKSNTILGSAISDGGRVGFGLGLNIWSALRSLSRHRLRSALTMLGIIIGIAAVITMVSVADGAEQRVDEQIRSLGANLLLVSPGAQKDRGVSLKAGSRLTLTEDDALAIESDIPEVIVAAPFISGQTQVIAGNQNWTTTLTGVLPTYLVAREWDVDDGELLSTHHLNQAAKVVLLGRTVVDRLFGERSPIGRSVRIGKTLFTVIGVLREKGRNASGQDQDDVLMMPLSTAKIRVVGRDRAKPRSVQSILVKVYDEGAMVGAARDIHLLLRQRHRLISGEDDDFTVHNLAELMETRKAATRQFTILVAVLASVSLIVGGIGIMNIMLVSVTERTRENGLRLAIGARSWDLGNQYLTESVTLSLFGGLIGIGIGVVAATGINQFLGWETLFRPSVALIAVIFSLVVGLVFGLYPALKAARLNPIDALRVE